MEPVLLKNITEELMNIIRGGIISKIRQPEDNIIIFNIFLRGRTYNLLISTEAREPRIHLSEKKYPNPERPLRFCAYLRSHIADTLIEDIRAVEGERIAHITLKKKGESEHLTLIAELTGKSSNIILVDSKNTVLDALKYFPPENSLRAVSPGLELKPLVAKNSASKETIMEKSEGSWNECADLYYSKGFEKKEKIKIGNHLRRVVKRVEKRLSRKIRNLEADIKKAEKNIENSHFAELLLVNFKELKRGMKEIELEDYARTPAKRVMVALDEKLAPNENIDRLFKLAKKGKKTVKLTTGRLPKTKKELDYLKTFYSSINESENLDALSLINDDLIKAGYIKKTLDKRRTHMKEEKKSEPIEKISREDGSVILIGKNGSGNDIIVRKYARANDLWFHAKGSPGAHVLLKPDRSGRHSESAIREAAGYAGAGSKIAGSAKVEVIMADAKEVKKPKGAKPGMVTVARYKSIMVEPKRDRD